MRSILCKAIYVLKNDFILTYFNLTRYLNVQSISGLGKLEERNNNNVIRRYDNASYIYYHCATIAGCRRRRMVAAKKNRNNNGYVNPMTHISNL